MSIHTDLGETMVTKGEGGDLRVSDGCGCLGKNS